MVNTMKQNFILDAGLPLKKDKLLSEKKEKNVCIKHFEVKEPESKKYKTKEGDYYTITFDDSVLYKNVKMIEKYFSKTFKSFLSKYHKGGPILFVGLGNSSILGDSFGVKVLNHLLATNQYNDFLTIPKVALFAPETTNKTGISSFKLIEMVVHTVKPDVLILLDSFVTKNFSYLNHSIELNNCGVIFADQIRSNKVIDQATFHVPVLSIGCPTLFKLGDEYITKYTLENDLQIISELIGNSIQNILLK